MAHCHGEIKLYQPIPFDGYEGAGHVRGDCGLRWIEIRKYLPQDLSNLSFFDYGCAEGYFMFMALQEGAKRCVFIDHDAGTREFSESLAREHGLKSRCEFGESLPSERCDVGLYLDVHFNGQTPTIREFSEKCDAFFVSPSGVGSETSPKLLKELEEVFADIEPIYQGYENRVLFKCKKEKV